MGNYSSSAKTNDLKYIEAVSRLEVAGQNTQARFFSYASAARDSTVIRNEILQAVRQTKNKCVDLRKANFIVKLNDNTVSRLVSIEENMEDIEKTLSDIINLELNDMNFQHVKVRAKEVAETLSDVIPLCKDLRRANDGIFTRLGNSVKSFCNWFRDNKDTIRAAMHITGTVVKAISHENSAGATIGNAMIESSKLLGQYNNK